MRTFSIKQEIGAMGRLFPTEVSRDFAPLFGVPFEDGGCVGVFVEPLLRLAQHLKERLIGGRAFQFRLRVLLLQPC